MLQRLQLQWQVTALKECVTTVNECSNGEVKRIGRAVVGHRRMDVTHTVLQATLHATSIATA